ncbi:MAG: apolipoprotein N-acyltransferase [Candidatus Omnitrophica bacterium]|nr:apolipoprotein N-acyltransferase [Candidatus Omnitrophota bacterium]MCM8828547.1 apolipoprotein N-acyltransferase [Candidatus Omnitrophota bacterium]
MKSALPFILSIAFAAILCFAFPPFSCWFIAWIGLVPLFLILDNDKIHINKFIAGLVSGFVFHAITLYWISSVAGVFYLFLALYLGFFWGIFFSLIFSFRVELRAVIGTSLWYFLEIILQHLFTGFPWVFISLSQWNFPLAANMASIIGSAGLSTLIVSINISIYLMLKHRKFIQFLSFLLILVLLNIVSSMNAVRCQHNSSVKIFAIQGNAGYFGQDPWGTFEKYRDLTDSIKKECDLAVWPESSYPSIVENDSEVLKYLIEKSYDFPILIGSMSAENGSIHNSAFLFNRGILSRYDKSHLVPFGEYVPGKKFSFVKKAYIRIAGGIPDMKPGKNSGVFNLNSKKFAVLICFENIFPEIAQKNMQYNPNFFVTITNDSWYGHSFGPYQHFAHNIFRAIETGRYVIQVSTTGITGYATPNGKFDTLGKNGEKLFIRGIQEIDVPECKNKKTIYTLAGETTIAMIFLLLTGAYLCKN